MNNKQLVRHENDRMVLGVAAGLADYLNIDPVFVRLGFALLTIAGSGFGLVLYILLALIMPSENAPAAKANVLDDEEIIVHDA